MGCSSYQLSRILPTIQSWPPLAQSPSVHVSRKLSAPPPPMTRTTPDRATMLPGPSRTSKDSESPRMVYPRGHTRVTAPSPEPIRTQPLASTVRVPRRAASIPLGLSESDLTIRRGEDDEHPLAAAPRAKTNPRIASDHRVCMHGVNLQVPKTSMLAARAITRGQPTSSGLLAGTGFRLEAKR